jgi:hypothetical protein
MNAVGESKEETYLANATNYTIIKNSFMTFITWLPELLFAR